MTTIQAELAEAVAPDFEVLRRLDTGSTSMVYLAREVALRRLVVIKVPKSELAADPRVRQRFEREARAAARVRHLSATTVHRIGRLPDGTPYLVLEYVDGRTLEHVLRAEGPFAEPVAVRLLAQVAHALAAAHAEGVVHRDVRPDNVFWVAAEQRAVLTDFGIAGILESGSEVVTRLTRPGEPLGDPAYRSPEQLTGTELTPASDMYAFGLLAYEVLTTQRPFFTESGSASRVEIATSPLLQPPRDLRDMLPEASDALATLLLRCLSREPRHRPAAAAAARVLDELQAGTLPAGRATGVRGHLQAWPALAAFLHELRQRRVYNVALGYLGIAFIVLQGVQLVIDGLPVPGWTYTIFVTAALAGFPVAVILAWMYDLTASGIRRADAADFAGPRHMRWLLPLIGLTLSLVIAGLLAWWALF
jgi:eukaryotic-like serine/threonine-protein kinase